MKFYSLIFKKTKLANEIESVIKKELSLASFYTNPNYHVYVECNSPVFQNNQQGQLGTLPKKKRENVGIFPKWRPPPPPVWE